MLALIFAVLTAVLPACTSEDDTACYWDAAARGNGVGTSFVALTDDVVLYQD